MRKRSPVFLIICSLYAMGCLNKTSEQTAATPPKPATLADLHLSLAKPVYRPDEPIPLNMKIKTGKFDLLVPYATVEGTGAFTELVIKNALSKIVEPTHPITSPSKIKVLPQGSRGIRCVQGIDLKAGIVKKAALEDLRTYYNLEPGDYTLQVLMEMKIYREIFVSKPQQIIDLERERASVQSNTQMSPDAKRQAITYIQSEIEYFERKQEEKSKEIYLPLNALRGSKELASNTVVLTIQ
jgi:hypothetical protein